MLLKALGWERVTERKREDGEEGAHVSRSGRGAAAKEQTTRQAGNQKHVSWKPSKERASKKRVRLAVPNCQSHWDEGSEVMVRFGNMVVMAGLVESTSPPPDRWGQTCPEGVKRGSADLGN